MSQLFREREVELPFLAGDGLLAQAYDGRAGLEVRLGHFQGGLFQEQAIEEDQVRLRQRGGDGWSGFESMGVYSLGHDAL